MPIRWRSRPRQVESPDANSPPATRDLDAEIASLHQQLQVLKPQMADALDAWLDATALWAVEFWRRSITHIVDETPDTVVGLGDHERSSVKNDAAGLIANARPHIQSRLVDDRIEDWPHLKPQSDPQDQAFRKHGTIGPFDARKGDPTGARKAVPEALAGRLNAVLGDLATIFANHGVILPGFEHGDPYGHRGQWHPDREHKPDWSDEMVDAMAAYARLHDAYIAALADAPLITAEKQRAEATELWNRA